MKNENWLRDLLYKEVYLGDKEKNGKIYQKYKLVPKVKIGTIFFFIAISILVLIILVVALNMALQQE